jgi:protein involved in polysaccharide export with SLBB domain
MGTISFAIAQVPANWNAQQVELSRAQLDSLLSRYEQTAQSSAYSGALRDQANRQASLIRGRLQRGDFQIGDVVALSVEGETALTDTFTVQQGPVLLLPGIGSISLSGILRAELENHLRTELARFIRNPVVHAQSSVRLLVSGAVGQPGFKSFGTTTVFSDVLAAAGGPVGGAQIQRIRVERSDRVIWEGEALQQAIIEGRTLDQMSLQAGDHVVVPMQQAGGGFLNNTMARISAIGSLVVLIGTLIQIL